MCAYAANRRAATISAAVIVVHYQMTMKFQRIFDKDSAVFTRGAGGGFGEDVVFPECGRLLLSNLVVAEEVEFDIRYGFSAYCVCEVVEFTVLDVLFYQCQGR